MHFACWLESKNSEHYTTNSGIKAISWANKGFRSLNGGFLDTSEKLKTQNICRGGKPF